MKMFLYVSLVDLSIVLPRVFFLITLCLRANLDSCIATSTCTHANVTVVINVLASGCLLNKVRKNQIRLFLHDQLVLDIRPRC